MIKIYTKNDIEGICCAILLKYAIDKEDMEIIFKPYNQEDTIILSKEDINYVVCLNSNKYKGEFFHIKEPREITTFIKDNYYEKTFNSTYKAFCDDMFSYIDWSWKRKGLYYVKNIDELSKYYNKANLVSLVADRIKNKQELVTSTERNIIVFSKRLISDYIDKKSYRIDYINGYKIVYTFSDINEIELANKLLEMEDADIAITINLSTSIVRFKSKDKNDFIRDTIKNLGGKVHSSGGTLKIEVDSIYDYVFKNGILKIFKKEGLKHECSM